MSRHDPNDYQWGLKKMSDENLVSSDQRRRMIAEAAYFIAEKRGFDPRDSVTDWLQAEQAVDRQLCARATARVRDNLEWGLAFATKKLSSLRRRTSKLVPGASAELSTDIERLNALKQALRTEIDSLVERGQNVSERALQQAERIWTECDDAFRRFSPNP
jgi:hypothetical protein